MQASYIRSFLNFLIDSAPIGSSQCPSSDIVFPNCFTSFLKNKHFSALNLIPCYLSLIRIIMRFPKCSSNVLPWHNTSPK